VNARSFGALLRQVRLEKGLTQKECAARMGFKSVRAWAAYEAGDRSPTLEQAEHLLHVFGYTAELVVMSLTKQAGPKFKVTEE
jgi:transcriptional regulator with XRE-family HTH domain